jgi:hypothetical protein
MSFRVYNLHNHDSRFYVPKHGFVPSELKKQGWEEKHSLKSANEMIDSFNNIARISVTGWHRDR